MFGEMLSEIESQESADCVLIAGPILFGMDDNLRDALDRYEEKRPKLTVILDTPGGIVEVVERMVETIRTHYAEVDFVVPDRAMSAGTIFVMSGDRIRMDFFSRLGPIDPQVEKDGRLVPALSYLVQYKRFIAKAEEGVLTDAEFALLAQMDLAELHQFEQAKELSLTLLKNWLTTYKFKDWKTTRSNNHQVSDALRIERALEIAKKLSDNELWHSHGRGISRKTLESDLNLIIDDLAASAGLAKEIQVYHAVATEYLARMRLAHAVHTRECLMV